MQSVIVLVIFTVVIIVVLSEDAPSLLTKEGHESTTKKPSRRRPTKHVGPKVTYNEYEPKDNGEYVHEVELDNGVYHKEIGRYLKGEFQFRGFFRETSSEIVFYIKDGEGFHYFIHEMNVNGTQEYGFGEEGEEVCSRTSDTCAFPASLMASMTG